MKTYSRLAVLLAVLLMPGTYFLPLWRIDLWAPQYPEGLVMKIWLDRLSGDVDIINGLNHYIGMSHIKEEMFPEFRILPYVVAFYIAFGLLTVILKNRKVLYAYLGLIILAGLAALYDFWQWGYEYGHNLDPNAPIKVPGMAYQPPLLGYKELLNFGAYSMPDVGGWLFIGSGLLVAGAVAYEWFSEKKRIRRTAASIVALLAIGLMPLQSCTARPEPIRYGQASCHHCKMTIMDQRFAAQIVTQKGKASHFDDLACLVRHLKAEGIDETGLAHIVVNDFARPGELIDARTAVFLQSKSLKSPMMGQIAAFSNAGEAQKIREQFPDARLIRWVDVRRTFD